MIVDDDVADLIALQRVLLNHDLIVCETSSQALKKKADIIITDLMFDGDISGIELVKKIKKKSPNTYCIIHTALADGNHFREASLIADRVVVKQNNLADLKTCIEAALI